jgi:hypothetical protein
VSEPLLVAIWSAAARGVLAAVVWAGACRAKAASAAVSRKDFIGFLLGENG